MAASNGKSASKAGAPKAPKKAASKPTASKSATEKKPSTRKTATTGRAPASGKNRMSAEERYRMVEVAAYFLAERNNFSGSPVDYWSQAEAQIAQLLGK